MRLRSLLSERLELHGADVRAYVLGEHGESQFVAFSCASVGGGRSDLSRDEQLRFEDATRCLGHEIARGKAHTNHGIALAAAEAVESIVRDSRQVMPVSVRIDGFAGVSGVCLSLPVVIGRAGVVRRIDVESNAANAPRSPTRQPRSARRFARSLTARPRCNLMRVESLSRLTMHDPASPPPPTRQFTSDNRSGVVPEVWAALQAADAGHAPSYGADAWTRRAADLLRETFECDCDVYFVTTGTAANGLALAGLCESYQAVVCHEYAHVETDECGAPEFFSNGAKLLTAGGADGKLTPEAVAAVVHKRSDVHYPRPRALSMSQSTELGTLYAPAELTALCAAARSLGLRTHLDGARFANAVASLGCAPADLTWRAGVDVLCLGGTKNGMLGSEAVLFFDRALGAEFASRCKQAGQLVSKMRFAAAQWVGLLEGGAWLAHAAHANAMARLVERAVVETTGLAPLFPVQANGAFFEMPPAMLAGLRARGWELYTFIGLGGVRFMCSWDTRPDDVERLRRDLADLRAAPPETCRASGA